MTTPEPRDTTARARVILASEMEKAGRGKTIADLIRNEPEEYLPDHIPALRALEKLAAENEALRRELEHELRVNRSVNDQLTLEIASKHKFAARAKAAEANVKVPREPTPKMIEEGVYTDAFQGVLEDREAAKAVRQIWLAMYDSRDTLAKLDACGEKEMGNG